MIIHYKTFDDLGYKPGDLVKCVSSADAELYEVGKSYEIHKGRTIREPSYIISPRGGQYNGISASWEKVDSNHVNSMTMDDNYLRGLYQLKVMKAFYEEDKDIEYRERNCDVWFNAKTPQWNWVANDYQVKTLNPDTIDWSHVNGDYNYMVRSATGEACITTRKPHVTHDGWMCSGVMRSVDLFTSYQKGEVDWKDSLVTRPGVE